LLESPLQQRRKLGSSPFHELSNAVGLGPMASAMIGCATSDLLHARAVDAAPNEDLVGGVEDARLRVRCGLPRRSNHLVNRAMVGPAIKSSISLGFVISRRVWLQRATVSGQDPRHFGGRTGPHQTEDPGIEA
jgi:hypothetical protein